MTEIEKSALFLLQSDNTFNLKTPCFLGQQPIFLLKTLCNYTFQLLTDKKRIRHLFTYFEFSQCGTRLTLQALLALVSLPSLVLQSKNSKYYSLRVDCIMSMFSRCDDFHWFNGSHCLPCECHGNSDRCNNTTGECLKCENNSTGWLCDMCLDGYYGDAMLSNCSGTIVNFLQHIFKIRFTVLSRRI